jgi:hypothetical protein
MKVHRKGSRIPFTNLDPILAHMNSDPFTSLKYIVNENAKLTKN